MQRVSVVGNSGSGKSTLARALAGRLEVTYIELDAIFHQPGWTELEPEEFRRRVGRAVTAEGWVVDGNYSAVRDLVWTAADTVVWLDLPRRTVMRQIVGRTLGRVVLRRELWAGNREPISNLTTLDPQRSIIAWAWTRHHVYFTRYLGAMSDIRWSHLTFHRLRSRTQVDRFLRAVPSPPRPR